MALGGVFGVQHKVDQALVSRKLFVRINELIIVLLFLRRHRLYLDALRFFKGPQLSSATGNPYFENVFVDLLVQQFSPSAYSSSEA